MSAQPAPLGRRYAGKSLASRRSEQRERIMLAARDVFATRRIDEWESLVEPISEFIARALVDPRDLA